jgi:UDP-GlcNAc:undecaprenyl-phosphate/decaprenyl-phosphate GlcNAc-1-phosphate transferase
VETVKDYVLTLLVAAVVTYLLTPLVQRGAIRAGALKQPRERDIHTAPVPTLGGVAMYAGLAAGLFVADQIPQLRNQAFNQTGMVPGLLLAGGLLVAIGIVDDRWGLSAIPKLAGQVAAGAILVATGTQLDWLPLPGGATFATTPDQSTLLTILIVVATINAVNFIDGLDGLAAGIVAIAAVSFLIYYYSMTEVVHVSALAAPALASAILTGVCVGFLPHNFHPARIFMGDTGAMLLGLVLAYAPISSIASLDPAAALLTSHVNRYPEIMPLLLPAALLVIPYADLLLAVVRRTRVGMSPFAADQKHLHHRLLQIGHSQRASVLVMYLWALLFSGSIVWFSLEETPRPGASNHHGVPVIVFVIITAAAILTLLLMAMPRWRNRDRIVKPQPERAAAEARAAVRQSDLVAVGAASPLPAPVALPAAVEPDVAGAPVVAGASAASAVGVDWRPIGPDSDSASGGRHLARPDRRRAGADDSPASLTADPLPVSREHGQARRAQHAQRRRHAEKTEPSRQGGLEPRSEQAWQAGSERPGGPEPRSEQAWQAESERQSQPTRQAEQLGTKPPPPARSVIGTVPPAVLNGPPAEARGGRLDGPEHESPDQMVWQARPGSHAAGSAGADRRHEQPELLLPRASAGHANGGGPLAAPSPGPRANPAAGPAGLPGDTKPLPAVDGRRPQDD